MAKANYRVCWWYSNDTQSLNPTCRTLSGKQHKSRREAAETALMQNPHALVRVRGTAGRAHGTEYRLIKGKVRRVG